MAADRMARPRLVAMATAAVVTRLGISEPSDADEDDEAASGSARDPAVPMNECIARSIVEQRCTQPRGAPRNRPAEILGSFLGVNQ